MKTCRLLIDSYLEFLRVGFEVLDGQQGCTIVTPFTDPSGDSIELTARRDEDGRVHISDLGEAYDFLYLSGVSPMSPGSARKDLIVEILKDNHCEMSNGEIETIVSPDESIGRRVHGLINAILSVEDLVYVARATSIQTFRGEVDEYLSSRNISFSRDEPLRGRSRSNRFDFVIRKGLDTTALRALSTRTASYAKFLAVDTSFSILDVKQINPGLRGIPILDDRLGLGPWEGEPLDVLNTYSDLVIRWMQREPLLPLVS